MRASIPVSPSRPVLPVLVERTTRQREDFVYGPLVICVRPVVDGDELTGWRDQKVRWEPGLVPAAHERVRFRLEEATHRGANHLRMRDGEGRALDAEAAVPRAVGVGDGREGEVALVWPHLLCGRMEERDRPHTRGDELCMSLREAPEMQVAHGASREPTELEVDGGLARHTERAVRQGLELERRDELPDMASGKWG